MIGLRLRHDTGFDGSTVGHRDGRGTEGANARRFQLHPVDLGLARLQRRRQLHLAERCIEFERAGFIALVVERHLRWPAGVQLLAFEGERFRKGRVAAGADRSQSRSTARRELRVLAGLNSGSDNTSRRRPCACPCRMDSPLAQVAEPCTRPDVA